MKKAKEISFLSLLIYSVCSRDYSSKIFKANWNTVFRGSVHSVRSPCTLSPEALYT